MFQVQRKFAFLLTIAVLPAAMTVMPKAGMAAPFLGEANSFAVLAGGSLSNSGSSTVNGDVGAGTTPTGDPLSISGGSLHINDGVSVAAMGSFLSAYSALGLESTTLDLSAFGDLGSAIPTLTGGVYKFADDATLDGTLTLNGLSNTNFTFLVGGNFNATAGSSINLGGGANFNNVNFVVNNNANLGAGASFQGSILAGGDITAGAGASVSCGRLLAEGDIDLDSVEINLNAECLALAALSDVPEPGTMALLGLGLLIPAFRRRKTA